MIRDQEIILVDLKTIVLATNVTNLDTKQLNVGTTRTLEEKMLVSINKARDVTADLIQTTRSALFHRCAVSPVKKRTSLPTLVLQNTCHTSVNSSLILSQFHLETGKSRA